MSLVENCIMNDGEIGIRDKVAISIDRLQAFEPPEGYYLAFSGGKDSQCIYQLALEAGVKFDAHYNVTTVDPPPLTRFIHDDYPDVIWDYPKKSMWQLIIEKKMPPTRQARYCCQLLKEGEGKDRLCVTGVRRAESVKRSSRMPFEVVTRKKSDRILLNDNDEDRRFFENCTAKGKRVVNPIIDWTDNDVWEFIHSRELHYCSLYDEGFNRLGCIGCPLASKKHMREEFARFPEYRQAYINTFDKMIESTEVKNADWKSGEDVMEWWTRDYSKDKVSPNNMILEGFG
ncbi:hypothetical protein AGMMS49975_24620 [Clostridia bacterium]|nr:hypothetical protein AGMMS49975_24620 [Clostridia bacterium]